MDKLICTRSLRKLIGWHGLLSIAKLYSHTVPRLKLSHSLNRSPNMYEITSNVNGSTMSVLRGSQARFTILI